MASVCNVLTNHKNGLIGPGIQKSFNTPNVKESLAVSKARDRCPPPSCKKKNLSHQLVSLSLCLKDIHVV